MESVYKSEDVIAAPIRVIQLLYNSGVSLKNVGRNIFYMIMLFIQIYTSVFHVDR